MILKECLLIKNRCYTTNEKIKGNPVGIVVHSTGANNKTIKRYVNPVIGQENYDEIIADIGLNKYGNSWNNDKGSTCVHAFIGENEKGDIETYKTLPFDVCCWGCGKSSKGSYNYNPTAHIQFEICEDNLKDETYFTRVMKEAQEFCAYICKMFNLSIDTVVSHKEAHAKGYASNHSDIDHWLKKFDKDMNWFRGEVEKILTTTTETPNNVIYRVQVGAYSVKANAEKMLEKLKAAGFNGYIKKGE